MNDASPQRLDGLRLCICTPDYVHLVKNGGIGTSFHHTASVLTRLGADVTVLYANRTPELSAEERRGVQAVIAGEGATLEYLFPIDDADLLSEFEPSDIYTVSSYLAYRWLKDREFDVVLFADWRGVAYFSVHARKQGLAFANTELWIQGHSTMLWHEVNNQATNYSKVDIRAFHYERKSIELSDRLLCATDFLLEWKKKHGFVMPEHAHTQPLLIDASLLAGRHQQTTPASKPDGLQQIDEIVFFGRLEKRKGLHLFIQALQRLKRYHPDALRREGLKVTFLGKMAMIDGLNSADFIDRGMADVGLPYTINVSLSSDEAVAYLRSRRALAVMPSLTDNSPLTVHECMDCGIPFIAAATGGIPELIHADDHGHTLVKPFGPPIADRIAEILRVGQASARPAIDQAGKNTPAWVSLLAAAKARVADARPVQTPSPLVSVCLTHYERPALLRKTLDGLAAQSYRNFEIIVVDNDSRGEAARDVLERLPSLYPNLRIQLHRLPDLYAGAARNFGLSKAQGEFLIFMDDDNFAHPSQIETFVKAIQTSSYDALSSAVIAFEQDQDPADLRSFVHLYLPAGSGLSLNLFGNAYGDANGIFRKTAVEQVGGFTEDRSSWEDYELYSRLEQSGFKVGMVPEALVYLRYTVGGVSRQGSMLGNYYRALRPALDNLPWSTFGDAVLFALNSSLQEYAGLRFDATPQADDPRLVSNFGGPIVTSRLPIQRLLSRGKTKEAPVQLDTLAGAAPSLAALQYDVIFARLKLQGRDALRDIDPALEGAAALAPAFDHALVAGDFEPIRQVLEQLSGSRELSVDESYLFGLSLICLGRLHEGLRVWARMLLKDEAAYVKASPDLAAGVKSGALHSGIDHYLRHGQYEGRPFNYVAPFHQPFGRNPAVLPSLYYERIAESIRVPTTGAAQGLRELLRDIVRSGSPLAAFDFAKFALTESERRYLGDHPDVAANINNGLLESAAGHWDRHGSIEGRLELITALQSSDLTPYLLEDPLSYYAGKQISGRRFNASFVQGVV